MRALSTAMPRSLALAVMIALLSAQSVVVHAADLPPRPIASPANPWVSVPAPSLYDPQRFELRAGVLGEVLGAEKGTVGVNAELLFPRFFVIPVLPELFTPRLHVGVVAHTSHGTSFVYAGATWTHYYTERIFGELYFGATWHNGQLYYYDPNRNALGCRVLFHVGVNHGYRFDQHWSVMLTLDHSSAGTVLTGCRANESLNQVGVKVGYQF